MQQNNVPDSALEDNAPTKDPKAIEYQSTKYEQARLYPFNEFECDQEARSLGLIENMTDSLTNQITFQNENTNGVHTCLGAGFILSNYNVICGRGKRAYNHIGNRRFKLTIAMHLRNYVSTNLLTKKSEIIDAVINHVREATGSMNGTGFLKEDSAGNWYDVGLDEAREKTARAFRDYSLGIKRKNVNRPTSWDDERKKRIMEIQNSIFKSCQIKFSGEYSVNDTQSQS